jgi:hypothetical protein
LRLFGSDGEKVLIVICEKDSFGRFPVEVIVVLRKWRNEYYLFKYQIVNKDLGVVRKNKEYFLYY